MSENAASVDDPDRPFKEGDRIKILPEWSDPGDNEFTWEVVGDEEKGRVDITPIDIVMVIAPRYAVRREWIRLSPSPSPSDDDLGPAA